MTLRFRSAAAADAGAVAALLRRYMTETLPAEWRGNESALRAAIESGRVAILLATEEEAVIGFAATAEDFDLHHCARGLRVIDVYVDHRRRIHGIGIRLLAHTAQSAIAGGFEYLRGEAVNDPRTRRLFRRFALANGDSFNVSSKALRVLAELGDRPIRQVVRCLPTPDANREP